MSPSYTLIRSRRKTVSLQITPAGEVIVRCPSRFSKGQIDAFVQSKEAWIQKHLARMAECPRMEPLSREQLLELADRAARELPLLAQQFAAKLNVSYGRITIRSQRTRWGSCSAQGNLNFNCLLMLCPEAVRDYVVVHELCHLIERNHSHRFWSEVEKVLPAYSQFRNWLNEDGKMVIRRLPKGGRNLED